VIDFNADSASATNTGQFIVAISIEAFGDVEAFKRNVDEVVRDMRASPTLPGFDEVRMPGERAHRARIARGTDGIPIHEALSGTLEALATDLGIDGLG